MAQHITAFGTLFGRPSNPVRSACSAIVTKLRGMVDTYARYFAAGREIERILRLSDAQLLKAGLQRDEVGRHALIRYGIRLDTED